MLLLTCLGNSGQSRSAGQICLTDDLLALFHSGEVELAWLHADESMRLDLVETTTGASTMQLMSKLFRGMYITQLHWICVSTGGQASVFFDQYRAALADWAKIHDQDMR